MMHRRKRKRIGRIGLFIYLLIYLGKTDANVVIPCCDPFNEQWLVAIQTPAGWLMSSLLDPMTCGGYSVHNQLHNMKMAFPDKLAAFIVAVRLCGIVLQVTLHVVARPDLHDLTKQENWERRAVARMPSTPKIGFFDGTGQDGTTSQIVPGYLLLCLIGDIIPNDIKSQKSKKAQI